MHWLLVAPHCYKKINQQNLNHSFWPILEFRQFREKKFYHHIFLDGKSNFRQVLDSDPRFWKRCSGVCCQTVTYNEWNWPKHLIFKLNWGNSISGSDKTEIFIYKVPFTLHLLVELIHNRTIAKEQKKLDRSMPSKKEPQS